MKKKLFNIVSILGLISLLGACGSGSDDGISGTGFDIRGAAQKGPFLSGSTVTVNILSETGVPTSNTVSTQTNDDLGSFAFRAEEDSILQISVDGYHFNEIKGTLSDGPLTLRAIYSVSDNESPNAQVNILTHLIHKRVLKLILEGNNATKSIIKAQLEFIDAFQSVLIVDDIQDFSSLNLYDINDQFSKGNAYLLALSSIVYQYAISRSRLNDSSVDAELTAVLNYLVNDFANDAEISDVVVLSDLTTSSRLLRPDQISDNLRNRSYQVLSQNLQVAQMDRFIDTDGDGYLNIDDDDIDGDGELNTNDDTKYGIDLDLVAENTLPIAANFKANTDEDTSLKLQFSVNDLDGDALSLFIESQPNKGVLSGVLPNVIYTPYANISGKDSFSYRVSDGQGDSEVATAEISIMPVNDLPMAASFKIETNEDTSLNLAFAVSDLDGDVLGLFVESQPNKGVLSGELPNVTYTPFANVSGKDSFTYRVSDGQGDSKSATVEITITPINDPPTITGSPLTSIVAFQAYSFAPASSDLEGDNLNFTINTLPSWATFDDTSGMLQGTPNNTDVKDYESIVISVSDGLETVELTAFSINVSFRPWEAKASLNTGRHGASSNLIDGKIMVVGGFGVGLLSSVEIYVPATNEWGAGVSMPTARRLHTSNIINAKVYVVGGEAGTILPTVEEYDPIGDAWSTKNPMPTSRSAHASCVVSNKIYVFGGFTSVSHSDSTEIVEEYDPATDSWQTKMAMPSARWGAVCATIGGKIYLFGGAHKGTLVEIYDPISNSWASGPSMLTGFRYGAAISSVNGKIYILGGYDSQSTVQEFDPTTSTWRIKSSMPTEKYSVTSASYDNVIYLFGGRNNGSSNNFSSVLSYYPLQD